MGSLSLPKLPIIDFSDKDLQPGTESWSRTRENARLALEQYGCFAATYDGVSLDLHNAILHEMERLFDLPTEVKVKNVSDKPYHGYTGSGHSLIPNLLEGLGIDNGTSLESIRSFVKLMWPNGNQRFCDAAALFAERVSELERVVKRMVFESYGAQKHYESHVESSQYLVRFMKYNRPRRESEIGCHVHTDKSLITILHQNGVSGLEVETRHGEWIGFEPSSPASFIVMAGDALMAWSNGRIHSAAHRVVMKSGVSRDARYSIGLFTYHTGIIQIPQQLADDEHHPLQYRDFDHYGLLHYFAAQPPEHQAISTAKPYCGII